MFGDVDLLVEELINGASLRTLLLEFNDEREAENFLVNVFHRILLPYAVKVGDKVYYVKSVLGKQAKRLSGSNEGKNKTGLDRKKFYFYYDINPCEDGNAKFANGESVPDRYDKLIKKLSAEFKNILDTKIGITDSIEKLAKEYGVPIPRTALIPSFKPYHQGTVFDSTNMPEGACPIGWASVQSLNGGTKVRNLVAFEIIYKVSEEVGASKRYLGASDFVLLKRLQEEIKENLDNLPYLEKKPNKTFYMPMAFVHSTGGGQNVNEIKFLYFYIIPDTKFDIIKHFQDCYSYDLDNPQLKGKWANDSEFIRGLLEAAFSKAYHTQEVNGIALNVFKHITTKVRDIGKNLFNGTEEFKMEPKFINHAESVTAMGEALRSSNIQVGSNFAFKFCGGIMYRLRVGEFKHGKDN